MATANVTRGADAPIARKADPSTNLRNLQDAVVAIDAISQEAFSEIAAVARLALQALERPETYLNDLDTIATALSAIWSKAVDVQNTINATAEDVGCNHVDDRARRRWAAIDSARATHSAKEVRHD